MKPTILLLGLFGALLLTGFVNSGAFEVKDYLFTNETIDNVEYVEISTYTLVYISNEPVFILKNGVMITDNVEEAAIDSFNELYYPSEEEIDKLKEYIIDFNGGRFSPVQYTAPAISFENAEGYCDQLTFMNQEIFKGHTGCIGEKECLHMGVLLCDLMDPSYDLGCDPYAMGTGLYQFSNGKRGMDKAYEETMELFDGLNAKNIAERLTTYEENLKELDKAGNELVYTDLRFPLRDRASCRTCLGICPEIPLDFTILKEAENKVKEIKEKIEPLENMENEINLIISNTEDRILFKKGKGLYPLYNSKYSTLINEHGHSFEWAEETLNQVVNGNLANKYNSARELKESLENQLQTLRFDDNFELQLTQLENQLKSIEEMRDDDLTYMYQRTEDARLKATNRLIRARWYVDDSNDELVERLNTAGALYNQYLSGHIPPMGDTQYESQEIRFNELSYELDDIIAKSPNAGKSFAGFVRNVNREATQSAYSLIGASMAGDSTIASAMPILLLITFNFVLGALAVFLFITIAKANKALFSKKIILTSWTILLILFIGVLIVGSLAVYNMMTGVIGSGDYESFEYSLRDAENINIVIDERGAGQPVITNMDKCALLVETQLKEKNINKYRFIGTQCYAPDGLKSIEECENEFGFEPTYLFEYNAETSGYSFQNTYGNDAKTFGTADIFNKCEIGYAVYLGE